MSTAAAIRTRRAAEARRRALRHLLRDLAYLLGMGR